MWDTLKAIQQGVWEMGFEPRLSTGSLCSPYSAVPFSQGHHHCLGTAIQRQSDYPGVHWHPVGPLSTAYSPSESHVNDDMSGAVYSCYFILVP